MAVTVSRQTIAGLPYRTDGTRKRTVTNVTLDTSYPTGGESVTASDLGLNKVEEARVDIIAVGGTVNVANAFYDLTNNKVKVFDETPAEVANAADLSGVQVRITAWGW